MSANAQRDLLEILQKKKNTTLKIMFKTYWRPQKHQLNTATCSKP